MHNNAAKLKIALISPKGPLYRHRTGIFRKSLRACPLTLSTLASLVPTDLNTEIQIFDEGIEDLPDRIDADLVGMTVITGNAPRSYELAARFRREGKTVVLGGPHITLIPEDAQPHGDAIVTGYAESTWPELLRDFSVGKLKPRYNMNPGFSLEAFPDLPFPRRDLMKGRGYLTTNTFEATRGCIHDCEFCVVPSAWGRKPFQKPVSYVIEDIRRKGAKRLLFYDLNLIAHRGYAKELFRALIPLKVKWFGLSTVLVIRDPELFDLMVRSGCKGLLVGFETLSEEGLKSVNKGFNNPSGYVAAVKQFHDAGIALNGTFVFGSDTDTVDSFAMTTDFVIESKIDLPRFSILTPFPGTTLYKRLEREGRILSRDWSLYDGQHVVYQPMHLSVSELQQGHEEAWRKVYSYGNIVRRARVRRSDPLLFAGTNLGYRFYSHNLSKFYTCNGGMI